MDLTLFAYSLLLSQDMMYTFLLKNHTIKENVSLVQELEKRWRKILFYLIKEILGNYLMLSEEP